MKTIFGLTVILFLSNLAYSQVYKPPQMSAGLLSKIKFERATDVDKDYKKTFDECDKVGNRCNSDPNKLKTLLRYGDKALFFDSKMALDLDGSWVGCNCGNNMGLVDQCSTSYFWKNFPNDYDTTPKKERCKFYTNQDFVDSNKIPYIVIPQKFGDYFKINGNKTDFLGDLGVVIYKDKIVPVFVADQGPAFRIGEGSASLFRELGVERCKEFQGQQCVSYKNSGIGKEVLFLVFPNSKISKQILNKDNAIELVKERAMQKFKAFADSF
jgi:hypothetical protein